MTRAALTEVGVLLDEDLDVRLREPLAARLAPHGYVVRTIRDLGWLGTKNGPLLDGMAEVGLQVLVAADVHLYRACCAGWGSAWSSSTAPTTCLTPKTAWIRSPQPSAA